jgi:hypothetical protein
MQEMLPQRSQRNTDIEIKAGRVKISWLISGYIQVK